MPSLGKRLTACIVVVSGASLLSSRTPPPLSLSPIDPPEEQKAVAKPKSSPILQDLELSRRPSVTRQLSVGAIHRYGISLKMDEFFHVQVDQDYVKGQEIDIALRLYDPLGGKPLFEVDSPTDEFGSEEVFLLAKDSGLYHMDVVSLGQAGTYRIQVRAIRKATFEDHTNVRAAEIFRRAEALVKEEPPNLSQAVQEYLQAESLWSGVGNKRWQAEALERTAGILLGDWERTLELQTQALHLCRSVGDLRCTARLWVKSAITLRELGRLDAAEFSYREAIKISRGQTYIMEEAESLMNLGMLLHQRGHALHALEILERALSLWQERRRIDNQILVKIYLGIVYSSLGKYSLAMLCFKDAEYLLGSQPNFDLRAQIATRVSEIHRKKGDLDAALPYAQRSVTFRKKAGDLRGEAVSLASLSLIYRAKRDLIQARYLQEQALAIFRRLLDTRSEATTRYNLGLILLDQKEHLQARDQFDQAALLAQSQEYIEGQIMALYGQALAEKMRGNPIAARSVLESALKLIEAGPKAVANEGSETSYMIARHGAYELMIDLLVASPTSYTSEADKIRAFEVSERARWRLLLDALTEEQEREGLLRRPDPALLAQYEDVKRDFEETERKRERLLREDLEPDWVDVRQAVLGEELGALEARMRLGDGSDSVRASPVSLREAQELLDSNTILLEYFLGRRRSFLWLVTSSSIDVFQLSRHEDDIKEKALKLHDLLEEKQSSSKERQAERLAQELSDILLGPVASQLGTKRILLVPHGALHYVPFSALPEPAQLASLSGEAGSRSYLIERHTIVYEPSASILRAIRSEVSNRQPPDGFLAMLADPVFSSEEYPRLRYSRTEAEEILALVPPGEKTLEALGTDADLELALSGELGNYRYIHIAAHGVNNPDWPELSGIVLSEKDSQGRPRLGELRLQDIKNLHLPADLVVLSACKTAIGSEIHGEGFVALPQAFMQAGAARVVVSLWNVKDESTAVLMKHFYEALLAEGQPPSEALRTAQLRMLRDERWSAPYYWASFQIQGEWR